MCNVLSFEEGKENVKVKKELERDGKLVLQRAREKLIYEPSDVPSGDWEIADLVNWLTRGLPDRDAKEYYGDMWRRYFESQRFFSIEEFLDEARVGC